MVYHIAATGDFANESISTILVQILSIAMDSNRNFPQESGLKDRQWLLSGLTKQKR